MAKTNNSFSGLFRAKPPTDLIGPNAGGSLGAEGTGRVPGSNDIRALSMSSKDTPMGTTLGSPSSPNSGSAAGGEWTKLLQQTASRGIVSAAKGTFSLADLGGIGTALSDVFKLFGSGDSKTLPPLVEFELPNPAAQTVYVSSNRSSAIETPADPQTRTGLYRDSGQITTPSNQSAQIIQAVKHALLTSSSLNDVIAEI